MANLTNHPEYWLRDDAARAFDQAEADHGILTVNSAGRHVWEQQELIDKWNEGGIYNRPPYLFKPAEPPELSNHVRNGGTAVDIYQWRTFATYCEAYGFQHSFPDSDPVHFDFVGGVSFPDPVPPPVHVKKGVKMELKWWNRLHVFLIGPETFYYVADPAWLAYLRDQYGPLKEIDNGALTLELNVNSIPWNAVEACMKSQAYGNDGRHWSRLEAEGIAIRGKLDSGNLKALSDIKALSESLKPIDLQQVKDVPGLVVVKAEAVPE